LLGVGSLPSLKNAVFYAVEDVAKPVAVNVVPEVDGDAQLLHVLLEIKFLLLGRRGFLGLIRCDGLDLVPPVGRDVEAVAGLEEHGHYFQKVQLVILVLVGDKVREGVGGRDGHVLPHARLIIVKLSWEAGLDALPLVGGGQGNFLSKASHNAMQLVLLVGLRESLGALAEHVEGRVI